MHDGGWMACQDDIAGIWEELQQKGPEANILRGFIEEMKFRRREYTLIKGICVGPERVKVILFTVGELLDKLPKRFSGVDMVIRGTLYLIVKAEMR